MRGLGDLETWRLGNSETWGWGDGRRWKTEDRRQSIRFLLGKEHNPIPPWRRGLGGLIPFLKPKA